MYKMQSLSSLTKEKVFIIAEIGNNHDGDKLVARELIDIAAEAGVDAVKFQTFTGKDIVTPLVKANEYKGWEVKKYKYWYEFLDTIALPLENHFEVFEYARNKGLIPFSTPVSPLMVDFLETINNPIYKIASMDLTNMPLLNRVAKTNKPIIFSTGMGENEEIENAIEILNKNEKVILHCVSDYPTKYQDANLMTIKYLSDKYNLITGISDHSLGIEIVIAAVALGARVVEKHITYSRKSTKKAEHHFALEPKELKEMVNAIRNVEVAMGEYGIVRSNNEKENKSKFRRSLHINRKMKKGDKIEEKNISILRPAIGDLPEKYNEYIGKLLAHDIEPWTGLTKKDIL